MWSSFLQVSALLALHFQFRVFYCPSASFSIFPFPFVSVVVWFGLSPKKCFDSPFTILLLHQIGRTGGMFAFAS